MTNKTTPRPWTYDLWTTGGGRVVCGVVFDSIHAYITSHNPNYSDDAALIVRAVNAHEAHQELVALCTGILECLDQGDQWKKPARLHAAGLLRAALEKARGSS